MPAAGKPKQMTAVYSCDGLEIPVFPQGDWIGLFLIRRGAAAIYSRIGMGLEVCVYEGLTRAEGVELERDGYPGERTGCWRAAIVIGTGFAHPGGAAGVEEDAV